MTIAYKSTRATAEHVANALEENKTEEILRVEMTGLPQALVLQSHIKRAINRILANRGVGQNSVQNIVIDHNDNHIRLYLS